MKAFSYSMIQNHDSISSTQIRTEQKNLGWASLGLHTYVKILIISVLFCYLFFDEIDKIVSKWLNDPSWSHGFLIPFFSLYFLNQHKNEIISLEKKPSYLGLFFLICCIVLYPLNYVHFRFAYGEPMLMIVTMGAIVLFLGGWCLVRYAWLPVSYLIFAVPLPARFYREITIPMRRLAAQVATVLLNFVPKLEASVSGVVIDVIYKGVKMEPSLDVAEACSGMRLLMAFMALGVAMAYLHYRPMWQRLILLAATIPIAIFCNVIRVTVTGFIYILWDPMYAQGVWHDLLGMLMLPLAFGLYGCLAWFMSNIFTEEPIVSSEDIIVRRREKQNKDG